MRETLSPTLKLFFCLCIPVMAGCAGNSARFANPLIEPEEAELPLDLCGHWQFGTYMDEDATVVIVPAGENFPPGFIQICGLSTDESEIGNETIRLMIGFAIQIQGEWYFNQPITGMNEADTEENRFLEEWDESSVIGWQIWKFSTHDKFLEMIPAPFGPLRQAIEENRLHGQITIVNDQHESVLILASSESLRDFIQQTPELFDPVAFDPRVSVTINKTATPNPAITSSRVPYPWWVKFAPLAAGCGFGIGMLICLMFRTRSNR